MGLLYANRATVALIDGGFVITINTALDTGDSFQLPLPSGQTYDFVVDWGDSSSDTITAYNQAETLHSYSSGGIYQITITGKCGGWSFNNGGDKLKVTSVDQWGDVDFDYFIGAFYGTANMTNIPNATITGVTNVTQIGNAFRGSGITAIPSGMLDNFVNVTQATAVFSGCSSLAGAIPSGLLDSMTKVTTFSGFFYNCQGLTGAIPSGFFDNNTLCTNFTQFFILCYGITEIPNNLLYYNSLITTVQSMFDNCRNLILPSVIFNLSTLGANTSFSLFMEVSNTSYSPTGTIQDVWNYVTTGTHIRAFRRCTALTNYSSIPNDWKGL